MLRDLVAALAWLVAAGAAAAAPGGLELLLFEAPECPYCAAWEHEVGTVYARTEEGHAAPLRRLPLHGTPPPSLQLAAEVRYSPTFVLVRDGRELGRITGYPGEAHFWGLLDGLLARAAARDEHIQP